MRRIIRIDRSLDRVLVRANPQAAQPYRCLACRHQASSFSTSSSLREKESFRDRVRRRLLGEENVVANRDPYTGPSQLSEEAQVVEEPEQEATVQPAVEASGDYEPADTWDGLERVGGFKGWWKQNWDPEHPFEPWLPERSVKTAAGTTAALHRAIVEVFALKQAGRPLLEVSQTEPGIDLTQKVQITPSNSGANLQFTEGGSLEEIVQSLAPVTALAVAEPVGKKRKTPAQLPVDAVPEDQAFEPVEEVESVANPPTSKLVSSWDPSWLQISLVDPAIKFAVLKRTMQLTGVRIPDNVIKSSNTARALLTHIITPPKPKKLVEELNQKNDLVSLPNVTVWSRKITSIDKEQRIGRWKVIEEELKSRNLPVKNIRHSRIV
ncbi:Ribosomal L50 mitochondria protein [Rutstroemia sp. NJR-2017a BBW]|nr:Ribosomal L50 mitochondria protein [Rutstroemia sp. NJR-2017a BBW]